MCHARWLTADAFQTKSVSKLKQEVSQAFTYRTAGFENTSRGQLSSRTSTLPDAPSTPLETHLLM